jgi:hypothetical protein
MPIEVLPPISVSERAALDRALVRAGIRVEAASEALSSPWLRKGVSEAVDRQPPVARYAPSPRSTRGATRA